MKSAWLGSLKDQEREDLKLYISSNKKLLDILVGMLYNMYRDAEKESFDYESASWAFKQAHLNGKKETLLKLIDICKLEEVQ